MIILLLGEDTFRLQKRLQELKRGFMKKYDKAGLNISILEGRELNFEDFQEAVSTSAFLSKKRLVIIKDFIQQTKDKKIFRNIVDFLDSPSFSKGNVIIFVEEGISEKDISPNLLFRRLKQEKVEKFGPLKGYLLNKWIKEEIRSRGGKIINKGPEILAGLVGSNLWQLDNEIEKLINYKKGRIITESDISFLVKAKFDENIFHLTDALGEKNQILALKLTNEQLIGGLAPPLLLSKLIWQFKILIQVKDFLEKKGDLSQMDETLKIHPYVASKASGQIRKFSLEELKEIYQKLLDLDLKIKTSQGEPQVLFDLFVVSVCQK